MTSVTGEVSKETAPYDPMASSSLSEVYLKSEPESEENTMYHSMDCELFQDLDLMYSAPAKEELVQTTEYTKPIEYTNTDTLNIQSPREWETFHTNSPMPSASYDTSVVSPGLDFTGPGLCDDTGHFTERFVDISSLPIVIEGLNTHTHTDTYSSDDSLEKRFVGPREVEWNLDSEFQLDSKLAGPSSRPMLSLDMASAQTLWPPQPDISTPEILKVVEQLQDSAQVDNNFELSWPVNEDPAFTKIDSPVSITHKMDYEPFTPKSEHCESEEDIRPNKRSYESDDSDESYTPYTEVTPRKYKRRKPNVPIKDMIQALESAQKQNKSRRGRPPKRRDSAVSSVGSTVSGHEGKYREIRDKNNEASKRSRMNRKLKELQMEQLAMDLEERNKKLQVKAQLLEEMTKKLKDALMTAILKP